MALVRNFEPKEMVRNSLHHEISATYSVFGEGDRRVLQIDTYGSEDRQIPGKKSQTLQLDRQGAEALAKIIAKEFGI